MRSMVLVVAIMALVACGSAIAPPKGLNTQALSREGILLILPDAASKITGEQAVQLAINEGGHRSQQATSVAARRVTYVPRGGQNQAAWLVTFDGLRLELSGRPTGAGRISSLLARLIRRPAYNTQLHVLLDDDGRRIFTYTHQ